MKYPYIPKEYYSAVMLACKIIREDKNFNKAINSAARYYGVDKVELAKHVRNRQGAGQKGISRTYKYYRVIGTATLEDSDYWETCRMSIDDIETFLKNSFDTTVKASNMANIGKQLNKNYDYGRSYYYLPIVIKEFKTKREAESYDFNKKEAFNYFIKWKERPTAKPFLI